MYRFQLGRNTLIVFLSHHHNFIILSTEVIIPTLKELVMEVTPIAASKWYDIGVQLNLDYWVLDSIQADFLRSRDCCIEVFKSWLSRDTEASWSSLITALNSKTVNEPQLAASLEAVHEIVPRGLLKSNVVLILVLLHRYLKLTLPLGQPIIRKRYALF